MKSILKLEINKFSKGNRRITGKLRDALKEDGINGENDEFKQMFSLIKEVEKSRRLGTKLVMMKR